MAKKAKGLEARVRADYRIPSVTAFGGREYVKGEWRLVPEGQADSAGAHPFLEVREIGAVDGEDTVDGVDAVDVVDAGPAAPPAGKVAVTPPAPTGKGKP
jgi:hypothetical protein